MSRFFAIVENTKAEKRAMAVNDLPSKWFLSFIPLHPLHTNTQTQL